MSSSNDIWVVFSKDQGHWWSRFLHPRIKHCYVVLPAAEGFIVHTKATKKLGLFNTLDKNGIIGGELITMGYTQGNCSSSLFMMNTCVGHTKQLLGINKPFIFTPYQLYKHLRKCT